MTTYANRAMWVQIGDYLIEYPQKPRDGNIGWKITFNVKKTKFGEPNAAELTVYNLDREGRQKSIQKEQSITIGAGYEGNANRPRIVETLFTGTLDSVSAGFEGPDHKTTIRARTLPSRNKVSLSRRQDYTVQQALKDALDKLVEGTELSATAAKREVDRLRFRTGTATLLAGKAFVGDAWQLVQELVMYSEDGSVSVNDTEVVLDHGERPRPDIPKFTPGSGLVGSPSFSKTRDTNFKHLVNFKALLTPSIQPATTVVVETSDYTFVGLVRTVIHKGDTTGQDWYSEVEAQVQSIRFANDEGTVSSEAST